MTESQSPLIRRVHEAATAVNIAFVSVALLMIGGTNPLGLFLTNVDRAISRRLGLLGPHTSFTLGYFAFFLPAVLLTLCVWVFLRLSAAKPFTRELLRSFAGVAACIGPQAWWFCFYAGTDPFTFGYCCGMNPLVEIPIYATVLFVPGMIYLFNKRPVPVLPVVFLVLLHYALWFWQYGRHIYYMGYGGPIGLTVGLCASLTWLLYLRQLEHGTLPRTAEAT